MATVFWDRKGILLIDFMPTGTPINSDRYCDTLRKLRRAIQNRRRGKLSKGVTLFTIMLDHTSLVKLILCIISFQT